MIGGVDLVKLVGTDFVLNRNRIGVGVTTGTSVVAPISSAHGFSLLWLANHFSKAFWHVTL